MNPLFRGLWSGITQGYVTFWFPKGPKQSVSIHAPVTEVLSWTDDGEEAQELLVEAEGLNAYFALGLRIGDLGPGSQGKKPQVAALTAFALDIDFLGSGHKAKNLPVDLDEASQFLVRADGEAQVPPSAVVLTGNGAHLYWFLAEPCLFTGTSVGFGRDRAEKLFGSFQAPMITKAHSMGFTLDSTSTIQRVWRIPGTVNAKTNRAVELVYISEDRYSFLDFGLDECLVPRVENKGTISRTQSTRTTVDQDVSILSPPEGLEDLWGRMIKYDNPQKPWLRPMFQAAVRGLSMANTLRDDALRDVTGALAFMLQGEGDPEQLIEVLRPSLTVWADEPGADKTLEQELGKAADKLRRAQANYHEKNKLTSADRGLLRRLCRRGVSLDDDDEVREEELTREFVRRHAILVHGKHLRVYNFEKQTYGPPRSQNELVVVCRDYWKDAPHDFVDLYYQDEKGKTKTKQPARLLEEYGTSAAEIVCDMSLDDSYFDIETETFFEASPRLRVTEPEFDAQFDAFLQVMAGERYGRLCDWLAGVPQVDKPLCAIYLSGAPGAGKDLISKGLARLWREGPPVDFERASGRFNAQLTQAPLLWINEGISSWSVRDLSTRLRDIVGSSTHEIENKGVDRTRTLRGYLRLLLCANNDHILNFRGETLGVDDQLGLAQRILYVPVLEEGARWLARKNVDGELTSGWVEGDGIARHVLWLAVNHEIKQRGRRFLVEGDDSIMHRKLATAGDVEGAVLSWLVQFATNPKQWSHGKKLNGSRPMIIGKGQLLVKTDGLLSAWEVYHKMDYRKPSTNVAGTILRKLSSGETRPLDFHNTRFHKIRTDLLLEWCEENMYGDIEVIRMNLDKDEWQ